MNNTIKITIYIAVIFLITSGTTFAHTDVQSNPMEQMMRQMMGDNTLEAMEQMEEQMMGAKNHERTEELMNKMFAGNLTETEQQEMIRIMRDTMSGPGAMTMMMGMMMPQMMQNIGLPQTFNWSYWVTIVLVWIALAFLIIALWHWINKTK